MSTIINADTSDGLKFTSDTSGEIKLQSAGTDIVSVTANGMAVDTNTLYVDATNNRVGVGTSSPSEKLHVSGTVPFINIQDSSGVANGSDYGGIQWLASNGNNNAKITVQQDGGTSGGTMKFWTRQYTTGSSTERMRIDDTGFVLIGTTTSGGTGGLTFLPNADDGAPKIVFNRVSTAANSNVVQFLNGGSEVGKIFYNGGATSYVTTSDYRLKENNVNITDGITRVKQLTPYRFNFIADADTTVDGFFAHEVQSVVPEAISGTHNEVDDDGNPEYQGIDQSKLVPLLTAALQEAITKIEDLETRIQALENA